MTKALGIDVSHWEGLVNYPKAIANGASFMYAKASQWQADPWFKKNWENAKVSSILRGAFHYLDWGWNEIEQAKLFVKTMNRDWGDLPPCLDLEMDPAPYKLTPALVSGKAWNFLKYVENATGRVPMIYTGYYYWNDWGSNNSGWAHFPLWLAWYAPEWWVRVPKPWTGWTFWQYTARADGLAFGCQSAGVDANWFSGTKEELYKFASVSMPVPTSVPTSGKYIVITSSWVFATPNDGIFCKIIDRTLMNGVVIVSEISGEWAKLVGLISGWVRLKYLRKQ